MSKRKTQLTQAQVNGFLQRQLAGEPICVQPLVEGEESQAFSYVWNGREYVLRINRTMVGFQKDVYAATHFHCENLPIPQVIQIGQIDENHAFCVTEKLPGITLQDVDLQTLRRLREPTFEIWRALNKCDLGTATGFGDFDSQGQGHYTTWQEFLLSLFSSTSYDWTPVIQFVGPTAYQYFVDLFAALVPICPVERFLIHGDFGANNVLTDGHMITAVLDWENAMYGDPLFDIAIAHFWSPWLDCMSIQAAYYDMHLSSWTDYQKRLLCYQLWIGLNEIHDQVTHHDWQNAQWVAERCTEIINHF